MSAASSGMSCLASCQPAASSARSVPDDLPSAGDGVRDRTGMHGSPHQRNPAARIDPTGQQQLGHCCQGAECADDVLGQLRPRGVTAGAAQGDVHLVDRGGNRPDLEGDLADIGSRVAVQRVDLGQVVQHAALNRVEGSPRAGLLRRLEDQPDASGQQVKVPEPGQHDADSEQDRGVHVVPACVANSGVLGGVVDVLAVGDGQGVDVGAQSHQTGGVVEATRQHIAVGAGADGKHLRHQPGPLELVDDESCGAMLVVSDLRMGVNIAPDGDQALIQRAWRGVRSRRVALRQSRVRASGSVFHADRSRAANVHGRNNESHVLGR